MLGLTSNMTTKQGTKNGLAQRKTRCISFQARIIMGALPVALTFGSALADPACEGHQLLPIARPPSSCKDLSPAPFASPDGQLIALVFPVDPSLHATPDMESRIDIRRRGDHVVASKDHSSQRGANGYHVVRAKWTPDSQFFVYSLSSSGGHSPWSFPMWVYGRKANMFVSFSAMIGGNPTLSANFWIVGRHTVVAQTWRDKNIEKTQNVTVNLADELGQP
jgi:hypothetical protein